MRRIERYRSGYMHAATLLQCRALLLTRLVSRHVATFDWSVRHVLDCSRLFAATRAHVLSLPRYSSVLSRPCCTLPISCLLLSSHLFLAPLPGGGRLQRMLLPRGTISFLLWILRARKQKLVFPLHSLPTRVPTPPRARTPSPVYSRTHHCRALLCFKR